jgi:hypothetical protein
VWHGGHLAWGALWGLGGPGHTEVCVTRGWRCNTVVSAALLPGCLLRQARLTSTLPRPCACRVPHSTPPRSALAHTSSKQAPAAAGVCQPSCMNAALLASECGAGRLWLAVVRCWHEGVQAPEASSNACAHGRPSLPPPPPHTHRAAAAHSQQHRRPRQRVCVRHGRRNAAAADAGWHVARRPCRAGGAGGVGCDG